MSYTKKNRLNFTSTPEQPCAFGNERFNLFCCDEHVSLLFLLILLEEITNLIIRISAKCKTEIMLISMKKCNNFSGANSTGNIAP